MLKHSTARFVFIRQAALAALVALSFLTSIVPFGAAAAPDMATMACCMGESGHCSSGLITGAKAQPVSDPDPDADPMCGAKSPSSKDDNTIVAEPTADQEDAHHNQDAASAGNRGAVGESSIPAARSIAKPCYEDCGAGPSGAVRRPKPREMALPFAIGRIPVSPRSADRFDPRPAGILRSAVKQIRPRGPPIQAS